MVHRAILEKFCCKNRFIVVIVTLDRKIVIGYQLGCNTGGLKGILVLGGLSLHDFYFRYPRFQSVATNMPPVTLDIYEGLLGNRSTILSPSKVGCCSSYTI